MFNRVSHFIKNITFNSGLNREKFINNKKIVNKIVNKIANKNNNMIIVRKISTYREPFYNNTKTNNNPNNNNNNNNNNNTKTDNNNPNNNNNNILYIIIMASGVYISHAYNNKKS